MKKFLILLAATLAACTSEPAEQTGGSAGGTERVQIKLQVPGQNVVTRGVLSDAQQAQIEDLDVLVFTTGPNAISKYVRRQQAELVAGETNLYEVELPVGTQKFLFVANAKSIIDDAIADGELVPNTTTFEQAMMLYLTVENHTTVWGAGEHIPMSFLTEATLANGQPHPFTGAKEVKMKRIVARVDLRFDAAVTNFKLDEVMLFNAARSGTIVNTTYSPLPPYGQTIAAATDRFAPNTGTNNCTSQIYMFEQEADYNNKTEPQPYIGIKGRYTDKNGVETTEYYRVNFSLGALFRNDRYVFLVEEVLGKGYPEESDLATAKAINLDIQTFKWDDSEEGDFIVNDHEYLYVSGDDQEFELDPDEREFTVRTSVAGGFTIKDITYYTPIDNNNPNRPANPADKDWLIIEDGGVEITNATSNVKHGIDNKSTALTLKVSSNPINVTRTASFLIKAGPLEKVVHVSQIPKRSVFAPPGVLGVGVKSRELTLRGSVHYKGTEAEQYSQWGAVRNETVYAVNFKHGSTVGMWWNPNYAAVAWAPDGWLGINGSQWNDVHEQWSNIEIPLGAEIGKTDPIRGFGDPCTYADGAKGSGEYRTPQRGYWLDSEWVLDQPLTELAGEKLVHSKDKKTWLPFDDSYMMEDGTRGYRSTTFYWFRDLNITGILGTEFSMDINPTTNYPYKRIVFNYAGGAEREIALLIRCEKFRYSPTLEYERQQFPWDGKTIPMMGGIYSVWTNTNLANAYVEIYEGRDESDFSMLVTRRPISLPTAVDEANTPQQVKTDISFSQRLGMPDRTLRFYLRSSSYNNNRRIHIGTTFQEGVDYMEPHGNLTAAPRITWDANIERFVLSNTASEAPLYFKFGSIVGLYSGNGENASPGKAGASGDPFDKGDVAWAPRTVTITDYASVPPYTIISGQATPFPDGYDDLDKNGSLNAALHHTRANILNGFGDPCRLVGLDLKIMMNGGSIDNGRWRTPTWAEYKILIGKTDETVDPVVRWMLYGGMNGTGLPLTGIYQSFMPVSGVRTTTPTSGITQASTTMGSYWTATKFWNDNQYESNLARWVAFTDTKFFMTGVTPNYNSSHSIHDAMAIRCVAQ